MVTPLTGIPSTISAVRLSPPLIRISQLLRGVNDIVLISFQSDLDGVGRVCLELISGPKTIAIGIIAAIAHPQAGGRRVDIQIKGFLALDECW